MRREPPPQTPEQQLASGIIKILRGESMREENEEAILRGLRLEGGSEPPEILITLSNNDSEIVRQFIARINSPYGTYSSVPQSVKPLITPHEEEGTWVFRYHAERAGEIADMLERSIKLRPEISLEKMTMTPRLRPLTPDQRFALGVSEILRGMSSHFDIDGASVTRVTEDEGNEIIVVFGNVSRDIVGRLLIRLDELHASDSLTMQSAVDGRVERLGVLKEEAERVASGLEESVRLQREQPEARSR